MKKIILVVCLLIYPMLGLAENLETDMPGVTIKNLQCSGNFATFNVVNKSAKTISYLYINVFDSSNDPIDKIYVYFGNLTSNSGIEYKGAMNCGKLARIGITVQH